jgi:hypothetical protein
MSTHSWNSHCIIPHILSLPIELIVDILASCPTIKTAACLSSTNKGIRAIWLKHAHQILESIVSSRLEIPAYSHALELADLQKRLPEDGSEAFSSKQPPIFRYFSRLLCDADLASKTIAAWKATMPWEPYSEYEKSPDWIRPHASYYLIRMIVLTHRSQDAKLKSALFSTLRVASVGAVEAGAQMCAFLTTSVNGDDLGVAHGIPKDTHHPAAGEWVFLEEASPPLAARDCKPEWQWAYEVTSEAMSDRRYGTHRLEDAVFKSVWCTKCRRHRHP